MAALEEHRVTQRKIDAGALPRVVDLKRTFGAASKLYLKGTTSTSSIG